MREALESGPHTFMALIGELGSDVGREIMLELTALREAGNVKQLSDGEWSLTARS